ncbi:hypothetical protein [Paraflavitalea speifideaquila]|uniref:hypothetical protein n=1 Tax=Paraflavitalea speifideaquila TaxID=3076558 RepID=UPI0028EEE75C|nr:hypothetical protein [Paraflavitalea speifideiaquila]
MRYRKQRHQVTSYPFTMQPAWYQTWAFRILMAVLLLASIGFLVVLIKLRRQRKKRRLSRLKKKGLSRG